MFNKKNEGKKSRDTVPLTNHLQFNKLKYEPWLRIMVANSALGSF